MKKCCMFILYWKIQNQFLNLHNRFSLCCYLLYISYTVFQCLEMSLYHVFIFLMIFFIYLWLQWLLRITMWKYWGLLAIWERLVLLGGVEMSSTAPCQILCCLLLIRSQDRMMLCIASHLTGRGKGNNMLMGWVTTR